jgi:hypothetical protein
MTPYGGGTSFDDLYLFGCLAFHALQRIRDRSPPVFHLLAVIGH